MSDSTQMISGLSSGIDWRTMVDQLIAVDRRPADLMETQIKAEESKKSAWQEINSKLAALKSSAETLGDSSSFSVYTASLSSSSSTVEASDILGLSINSNANVGNYSVVVNQVATNEKLSSASFSSKTTALGLSGDFLLGGRLITLQSDDSLNGLVSEINNANSGADASGVSASILQTADDSFRIVLTSTATGEAGVDIADVSTTNVVGSLGFVDGQTQIKNSTSAGAQTDLFTSTATAVSSLLGLSSAISSSGGISIGGHSGISIDLSDSLAEIRDSINSQVGATVASIVSEEADDGSTEYRLKLVGTSFVDDNNVLQALGVLEGTHGQVVEVHKGNALSKTSAAGSGVIDSLTKFSEINTGSDASSVADGDTITISGKDHAGNSVSGTYTITAAATATVGDLLTQIETIFGGSGNSVTASVDANGKITVTDDSSGESQLEVSLVANNEGGGTLDLGSMTASTEGRSMQVQAGQDAIFSIDGVQVTQASNSVSSVLSGVSMDLKKADASTTVTINVVRDKDAIAAKVNDFVSNYNSVIAWVNAQSEYDQEKEETGGPLFGDATMTGIRNSLMAQVTSQVSGASSNLDNMSAIGVTLKEDGTLEVNAQKLQGIIDSNFNDLVKLFSVQGSSNSGSLSFSSVTEDTEAGDYAINVTQAATKASVSGSDISGGIAADETLTIEDKTTGQSAIVSLTAGMDTDDVAAAITAEFAKAYNQTLTQADAMTVRTSQGGGNAAATTIWQNINTGGDADDIEVANNDVISFSGNTRSGRSVSGQFTITDITSDTVGDLLDEIEDIYGSGVSATIDSNGKIVVSDTATGMSQLSITMNYEGSGSLALGTMSQTTTGRYSMDLSASNSSGSLVISHDNYGSGQGFEITQTDASSNPVNHLGITDQEYTGLDVTGTIDGRTATGEGQILYLDEDGTDANGLRVVYSGTSTGSIGSISLTLGFGEVVDRLLDAYTDSYTGYIDVKVDGIDTNVESLNNQIEQLEIRLELKKQRLIDQFVAMERTLGSLQSQSSWLNSQLAKI